VKLADLVNTVGSNFREMANFVRYPLQNLSRVAIRRVQEEYERVELPWAKKTQTRENSAGEPNKKPETSNSNASRMPAAQELLAEAITRTSQVKTAPVKTAPGKNSPRKSNK
jgi:hypothetical protein